MDIDNFIDLLRSRRSIRAYKPDPIPDEYIQIDFKTSESRR